MEPTDSLIVVALGGNAISPAGAEGNIEQQFAASRETAGHLVDLVENGYRPIITHGNGPQVGNVLRRVELAAHEVYTIPLETCVADTQGGMGYMIAQCLNNELARRDLDRTAGALITTVEVDAEDPAFQEPTKPIGRAYSRDHADRLGRQYGWTLVEVAADRFRRVVPSPCPRRIVEIGLIRRLVEAGELLVVCGGGGIPVMRGSDGLRRGIEAVIDKDRTSALLARQIGAARLVIATGVPRVALNFEQPNEKPLDRLTMDQARAYLADGQFPPGSMRPKIEASLDFLEHTDQPNPHVIICDLAHVPAALDGQAGTTIVRD